MMNTPFFMRRVLLLAASVVPLVAQADGMQPESSIVIMYEADGEAAMNIRNTDATPSLLHTTIRHIPEDEATEVIVTPPVARVDPGQEQMVRFIYQGEPLKTQRLKRVIFEGIGQERKADGRAVVGVGVRQNLPLLLHPKGLPRDDAPWKRLRWTLAGNAHRHQ